MPLLRDGVQLVPMPSEVILEQVLPGEVQRGPVLTQSLVMAKKETQNLLGPENVGLEGNATCQSGLVVINVAVVLQGECIGALVALQAGPLPQLTRGGLVTESGAEGGAMLRSRAEVTQDLGQVEATQGVLSMTTSGVVVEALHR